MEFLQKMAITAQMLEKCTLGLLLLRVDLMKGMWLKIKTFLEGAEFTDEWKNICKRKALKNKGASCIGREKTTKNPWVLCLGTKRRIAL